MVAKGQSGSESQTGKLLKKAHRKAAPDVEDEILIRLIRTQYSGGGADRAETDNFLAVAHIDARRPTLPSTKLGPESGSEQTPPVRGCVPLLPCFNRPNRPRIYLQFFRLEKNCRMCHRARRMAFWGNSGRCWSCSASRLNPARLHRPKARISFRSLRPVPARRYSRGVHPGDAFPDHAPVGRPRRARRHCATRSVDSRAAQNCV